MGSQERVYVGTRRQDHSLWVIVVLCKHKDAMCSIMGGMFIKWLCESVLRVEFLTL